MRPASRAPRYSVQSSESQLWISIPPRRRLWSAGLLALFVLAWTAFLGILLYAFATQATDHLLLAACACLVLAAGIVCGAYVVAWELAGHEQITVTPDALQHSCRIGSLIRSRRHELSRVERIRVQLDYGVWWEEQRARRLHWPTGMIAFQYDGEVRRLGRYLTVREAQALLTMIEVRAARR